MSLYFLMIKKKWKNKLGCGLNCCVFQTTFGYHVHPKVWQILFLPFSDCFHLFKLFTYFSSFLSEKKKKEEKRCKKWTKKAQKLNNLQDIVVILVVTLHICGKFITGYYWWAYKSELQCMYPPMYGPSNSCRRDCFSGCQWPMYGNVYTLPYYCV